MVTPPALPSGNWAETTLATDGGFETGLAGDLSSQYFPIPGTSTIIATNDDACGQNCDKSADSLFTPEVSIPSGVAAYLQFDFVYLDGAYQGNQEEAYVLVSDDGGANWNATALTNTQGTWATATVDLSSYAGSNVSVGFAYNDGGGWNYGLALDNIKVFTPLGTDLALSALTLDPYVAVGTFDLSGVVTNNGTNQITEFDISYMLNNGTVETTTIAATIDPFNTYQFTHNTPVNVTAAGDQVIDVWVSNPNATTDEDMSNDSLMGEFVAVSQIPPKYPVLEGFTGTWCQFCPDGGVQLEAALTNNPNLVAVYNHSGDVMEFSDVSPLANAYISGYPGGMVDRFDFPGNGVELSRGQWDQASGIREQAISPIEVSMMHTYNPNTREISVDVTANFYSPMSEEIRLNCIVVEDSVTGGADYDQSNFYNTQQGHPYYQAGDPIQGYVHKLTGRAYLGGPWGAMNSVSGPIVDGYTETQTFTYTLPQDYDDSQIYLIGMAQAYDSDDTKRPVYNAFQQKLSVVTSAEDLVNGVEGVSVYPNPVSETARIDIRITEPKAVSVRIVDMMGRTVEEISSREYLPGNHQLQWNAGGNVAPGVYMVEVSAGDALHTTKVVVQ